ncbi:MAG: bifunctional oligoribonuclease/PAP phosphatase NrnA [Acutalibacteraceae bacterium]
MKINLNEAAEILKNNDGFTILTHRSPDGDTIGSAYALCMALKQIGKKARVLCSDPIPAKYGYFTDKVSVDNDFEEHFVVSTDVADAKLFGKGLAEYANKVQLCLDHHETNTDFAEKTCVDPHACAAAELIERLLKCMDIFIDRDIANALYTGICTDSGCFRYSNTTAETHRIAAELIEYGADYANINRLMFETKSCSRMDLERRVIESMQFYADGKIVVAFVTEEMLAQSGVDRNDTDGLASLPKLIEGVKVAITINERVGEKFKISVRTSDDVSASSICERMGGGGHRAAAGCALNGTLKEVTERIVAESLRELERTV